MSVFGVNQIHDVKKSSARKAKGPSDGAFSRMVGGKEVSTPSVSGPGMIGGVETLLAVQQPGTEAEERRRAMEYGGEVLRELEGLRMALVCGDMAPERLHSLARMVEDGRMKTRDPRLSAILDEIELRVRVELEKLLRPAH